MNPSRTPVMAGNWKMHKGIHETGGFVRELVSELATRKPLPCEVIIAPVYTALTVAQQAAWGSALKLAAQNCHWDDHGAFTGEVSAGMLKEIGVSHVVIGHSERRTLFGETDDTVAKRLAAVFSAGLTPILCVGETDAERDANATEAVLTRQLDAALAAVPADVANSLLIAYEPVWAIGTGRVATPEQAQEAHHFIRTRVSKILGAPAADAIRLLYGGSVKPGNVASLLACADVDGSLVGGASLEEADFLALIDATRPTGATGTADT